VFRTFCRYHHLADISLLRVHRASHVSKKYVDKTTSKKIRRAATPFIAWLDEEEEESDEEDDEEEEESA